VRKVKGYCETTNGDILGCGYYTELPGIIRAGWIFRLNREGDLLWQRYFIDYAQESPIPKEMVLTDILELESGEIMSAGYIGNIYNDPEVGNRVDLDGLLIRTDSDGCLAKGCNFGQKLGIQYPLLLASAKWIQVDFDTVPYSREYKVDDIGQGQFELMTRREGEGVDFETTSLILEETADLKVFIRDGDDEFLLYDFGLNQGDVFSSALLYDSLFIYEVDTVVLLDGTKRKRLWLTCYNDPLSFMTEWIEGIGDIEGILGPLEFCAKIKPESEQTGLACYFLGSEQLYHNYYLEMYHPNLMDCYLISDVQSGPRGQEDIWVYPNPANTNIYIRDIHGVVLNWRLFNEFGQCILSGEDKYIPLQTLAIGVYFVEIYTNNGSRVIHKVVKR
jgi:hypothetical protein